MSEVNVTRGTLRGFDAVSYTATVEVAGSIGSWLTGVPVARNIAPGELVSGRSVTIIQFQAG